MNTRLLIASLATAVATATMAVAQTPPSHVRGSIASVDGRTLSVTTREGPKLDIALSENVRIIAMKKADLSAITPGTFIGTAAKPGADGQLQAMEVVVFPESARGTGEGNYAWDLAPGTSMTNANVDAAVQSMSGRDLTLSYKGGSVKVTVPPDIPIVTPVPAARDDLKPGAAVFVAAIHEPNNVLRAAFVAVEKDGVAPPM